jgi:hypothetical protein
MSMFLMLVLMRHVNVGVGSVPVSHSASHTSVLLQSALVYVLSCYITCVLVSLYIIVTCCFCKYKRGRMLHTTSVQL